ncbi:MAG: ribonuclease P protein component [Candidatus Competibacteraceae bacterium]|nr:ribonuclease P protein component [Candidatus Competibacteraceae bacterium]
MQPLFRFRKAQRLCRKKDIDSLFSVGKSFLQFPLLIHYRMVEGGEYQMLVSIPKRKIQSAPVRNRMKRLIREAYRKRLPFIVEKSLGITYHIAITYVHTKEMSLNQIETALEMAIDKLLKVKV